VHVFVCACVCACVFVCVFICMSACAWVGDRLESGPRRQLVGGVKAEGLSGWLYHGGLSSRTQFQQAC